MSLDARFAVVEAALVLVVVFVLRVREVVRRADARPVLEDRLRRAFDALKDPEPQGVADEVTAYLRWVVGAHVRVREVRQYDQVWDEGRWKWVGMVVPGEAPGDAVSLGVPGYGGKWHDPDELVRVRRGRRSRGVDQ